jgi:hypothetical protein
MDTSVKTPAACVAALLLLNSCFVPVPAAEEPARLKLSVTEDATRSQVPDAGTFTLDIKDASGKNVHHALWGDSPAEFELAPGNYEVSVVSGEFSKPAFDSPQYGDSRTVRLAAGQTVEVELVAKLVNAGVRLRFSEDFAALYRGSPVFLQGTEGTLGFGLTETRTAFFMPGTVHVLMNDNGESKLVYSVEIASGSILTLKLAVAEKTIRTDPVSGAGFSLVVDTTCVRTESAFAWDGESSGGETLPSGVPQGAVGVAAAKTIAGSRDVWVYGYIVGGDLTSKACSFDAPFSSRTNLVLAGDASCRDRSLCMSVQLSAGDIRNALNLVDNPSLLGRKVYLRGDVVESYYKLPGLQNLTDYRL